MSRSYTLETLAQPNYYSLEMRNFNIYFDLPENDQKNTIDGIVIIIAGFGGNANSNVYKKMRRVFADTYNLVTVQCDYFGFEFMQCELAKESITSFCEMGPIQAMDNLIALKCVKDYLIGNNIKFDDTNVMAYGHSHGAYLAYLMNALMPSVLSCVIDNSAWLYPQYINSSRMLSLSCGDKSEILRFDYIVSKFLMDKDIYDLNKLYEMFKNEAFIISFHGVADNLISINDKLPFLANINNSSVEIIGPKRVNNMVKSYGHGLDADFLSMFDYVIRRYNTKCGQSVFKFEDRTFETMFCSYRIENGDSIPILYAMPKYDFPFEKIKNI